MNNELQKQLELYNMYQDYLLGGNLKSHNLNPNQVTRMERLAYVCELLKTYPFSSQNARQIHKQKFNIDGVIVDRDFKIGYYIFGQTNIFNQDSHKAWALSRLQVDIDKCRANGDYTAAAKLYKEYKEIAQLHLKREEEEGNIPLPVSEISIHPKALEYKKNAKLLDDHMKVWIQPKKKIMFEIQDAEIIKDEPKSST